MSQRRRRSGTTTPKSVSSSPLRSFCRELLVQKYNGQPVDTWILVSDEAKSPHKSLRRKVRGGSNQTPKLYRHKFGKSASSSAITDDDSDLIPFQLGHQDRRNHTKDRWDASPMPAPILMARKWRTDGGVLEKNHSIKESPRSVIQTPWNVSSSRDASPTMLKPRRQPSSNAKLHRPVPPPPLYSDATNTNTMRWRASSGPKDRGTHPKFLRLESDSSLICPQRTGLTLQASRPCYKVIWVKDSNHNYIRQVETL
jgi:hypothetical protein